MLRFVSPIIAMMVFTSVYSFIDGLFGSNYVGKTSFAAVNFIMPILMLLAAPGLMLGTGGSAIVGKTLGENNRPLANEYFSLLVYVTAVLGVLTALVSLPLLRPLAAFYGADGALLDDCVLYGVLTIAALPFQMLQLFFYSLFSTAEKPNLGFLVSVASGLTNLVLDAAFIIGLDWGLFGAGVATSASQAAGAVIALAYFARENDSLLRVSRRAIWRGKLVLKTCSNGASEMVSNIALSLMGMLYNYQLMRFAGENGVAAFGVVMYVGFIFMSVFFGYSLGCAPLVSYNFGARNDAELQNLFKKSLILIAAGGFLMMSLVFIFAKSFSAFFVGYDERLYEMTVHAFGICAFSFLSSGVNDFGSAFFTALNDGKTSAIISFLRTGVLDTAAVLVLPFFFGLEGVWWAMPVSDSAGLLVTLSFFAAKRQKYRYV